MNPVQEAQRVVHVEAQEPKQNLENYLKEAKSTQDIEAKKAHYEKAFQVAKTGPCTPQVLRLFVDYAMDTCYNQGDDDVGFRKAAALLELAVVLQCSDIKTEWAKASTLASLIDTLGHAEGQKSLFFDAVAELNFTPRQDPLLADTFMGLSFSYQNIPERTAEAPKFYDFHMRMNSITYACIGDDTERQETFAYNRARFMAWQKDPKDLQAQDTCFDPVLALIAKVYKDQPLKRDSRLAQIENMLGLSSEGDTAEAHFRKAIALREPLLGKFPTAEENINQVYLLCNARDSLIHCLLANKTPDRLKEASQHAVALGLFVQAMQQLNNANSYVHEYPATIQKVLAALPGYQ